MSGIRKAKDRRGRLQGGSTRHNAGKTPTNTSLNLVPLTCKYDRAAQRVKGPSGLVGPYGEFVYSEHAGMYQFDIVSVTGVSSTGEPNVVAQLEGMDALYGSDSATGRAAGNTDESLREDLQNDPNKWIAWMSFHALPTLGVGFTKVVGQTVDTCVVESKGTCGVYNDTGAYVPTGTRIYVRCRDNEEARALRSGKHVFPQDLRMTKVTHVPDEETGMLLSDLLSTIHTVSVINPASAEVQAMFMEAARLQYQMDTHKGILCETLGKVTRGGGPNQLIEVDIDVQRPAWARYH